MPGRRSAMGICWTASATCGRSMNGCCTTASRSEPASNVSMALNDSHSVICRGSGAPMARSASAVAARRRLLTHAWPAKAAAERARVKG